MTGFSTKQPVTPTQQSPLSRSSWKVSQWCEQTESQISPSKAQALWCTLNNKAVEQAMQAVSFNGEVVVYTNSLRYLGIHFDMMLTYKTQVEETTLRCKKRTVRTESHCCERHRKRHLFLLYQSVKLTLLSMVWDSQPCHSTTR